MRIFVQEKKDKKGEGCSKLTRCEGYWRKETMMPTSKTLSTSRVTSNDNKGRKATDLFRAAYDKVGLTEKEAQYLNENPRFPALLLRLVEELSADWIIRESNILKPEEPIIFPARTEPLDPNKFFGRSEISLWGCFRECILPILKPITHTPVRTYGRGFLKTSANDQEIRTVLPKRHLANWEGIASLIEMYPDGKEGRFLFYVKGLNGEVFTVRVGWHSDFQRWNLYGGKLGERGKWRGLLCVLCPSQYGHLKEVMV